MNKTVFSLAALCAGALISLSSCSNSSHETAQNLPTVDVTHPTVDSVVIHKSYPGRLSADNEVALVARVDGYLLSTNFNGGDLVQAGQVLARIEDTNYRAALAQAQASLAEAKGNLEYTSQRYAAMEEALKGDAVSKMEVAQAKSNYEQAKAAVQTAQAAVETAATQLSYCTIRATHSGHITSCNFSNGAYLAGSGSPVTIATLYEDAKMKANFAIEDNYVLGDVKQNLADGSTLYKNIPLEFAEHMAHTYTADLCYMAPQINVNTGTMQLQAEFANPYGELHSGMFVSVDLPVDTDPKAILIPDAAIASDQLGKYVYTVNDSNRVVYTTVETGQLVGDSLRIITKGLGPNDLVVTKALLKVRSGMEVNPRLQK